MAVGSAPIGCAAPEMVIRKRKLAVKELNSARDERTKRAVSWWSRPINVRSTSSCGAHVAVDLTLCDAALKLVLDRGTSDGTNRVTPSTGALEQFKSSTSGCQPVETFRPRQGQRVSPPWPLRRSIGKRVHAVRRARDRRLRCGRQTSTAVRALFL